MFDLFTRIDEILIEVLGELRGMREEIRKLPAAPPPALPPRVPLAPPPIEIRPITDRLDKLEREFNEYRRGLPAIKLDRKTTISTEYEKVMEWIVGEIWGPLFGFKKGELYEISIACGDAVQYTHAVFRISVDKPLLKVTEVLEEKRFHTAVAMPFKRNELEAGDRVKVEVRSDDGTEITCDAMISGREY